MKKRLLALCIVLLTAGMVFAGGSKESSSSEDEKMVVTLTFLGNQVQQDFLDKWIPLFEENNPDIDVQYTVLDWGTGKTKILSSFAGGVGSDIVMVYGADIPQWIEYGALSPIDEYFDPEMFIEVPFEMGKWNGKL